MPAGRPSKYDPAFCDDATSVVYGLCDSGGRVFYVGKAKNFKKRMAAYMAGRFHGNRGLRAMVLEHGLRPIILRKDVGDLNKEEFDEIESRDDLVNQIKDRNSGFWSRQSSKPWVVQGVHCPSTLYARFMRNAFGVKAEWLSDAISRASDDERMRLEVRLAEALSNSAVGGRCAKWLEATHGRA